MKFTKVQKDILTKGYENAFQSEDLNERFKTDYREVYEAMAKETLESNGYPKDVDVEKVDLEVNLYPSESYEAFVENLEESEKIEDAEAFANVSEDNNFYIDDILDNLGMVKVDVKFKADPSEYLEQYPDKQYFAKVMKQRYDESLLAERLYEDEEFILQVVEPQAREEGFENTDPKELKYSISKIEITKEFTELAEYFLQNNIKTDEETVTDFMRNRFYNEIIRHKFYKADIRFESDPNEEEVM